MGKHDKTEDIRLQARVMPNDWYEARIKALEKENHKLSEEIMACEHRETMLHGCIAELNEEIYKLKETIVRLAVKA